MSYNAIFGLQLLAACKIGPDKEELRTTKHRIMNKFIWLIGTSRNALLVVVCGLLGWSFQDKSPVKLIGMRYKLIFLETSFVQSQNKCPTVLTNFYK